MVKWCTRWESNPHSAFAYCFRRAVPIQSSIVYMRERTRGQKRETPVLRWGETGVPWEAWWAYMEFPVGSLASGRCPRFISVASTVAIWHTGCRPALPGALVRIALIVGMDM